MKKILAENKTLGQVSCDIFHPVLIDLQILERHLKKKLRFILNKIM